MKRGSQVFLSLALPLLFSSAALAEGIWVCKDKSTGQEQFTYNPVATETVDCSQLKDEGSTFSRSAAARESGRGASAERSSKSRDGSGEGKKRASKGKTKKAVKKTVQRNTENRRTGLKDKGSSKKK